MIQLARSRCCFGGGFLGSFGWGFVGCEALHPKSEV